MTQLLDRVALVTGGGRGIGRAIAREFGRQGAKVVISSRTRSDLDAVVKSIEEEGGEARAEVCDAMDREQVRGLVQATLDGFGRVDILVNNVGGGAPRGESRDPDDIFLANVMLNMMSAVWATRAALPTMKEQGYGRVINIGSGASKRSGASLAYVAAKHGVVGYTRQLAADVGTLGITVNCLCPGWTNTSLVDWDAKGKAMGLTGAEAKAGAEADNLQHRVLEPEELAPMATLLAAPSGGGITGQVISVDGGYKV